MPLTLRIALLLLLASAGWAHQCEKLNKHVNEVVCENLDLEEFPDFTGFLATTYKLNGNSFKRVTNSTFPPWRAKEIQISGNNEHLFVDSNSFINLSDSLYVLKLQDISFNFDGAFEPVIGLRKLNSLEIGSSIYTRNLSVPFLDKNTMDRLIWLRVVHSGIDDIAVEALDSDFKRLRHLSFSHNRLRFVPEGVRHVMALPRQWKSSTLEIDLSYNLLDTLLPDSLPVGCAATVLDLSYNNIRSVRLRSLDNCQMLTKLLLKGNRELFYVSPAVFPNNCYTIPRLEVHLQNSSVRNVELALRPCVKRVYFWDAGVPCSCRHKSLVNCARPSPRELFGNCVGTDDQQYQTEEARVLWAQNGCKNSEHFNPSPMPGAGDPFASLKDWGECLIEEELMSTTTTTTVATTAAEEQTSSTSTTPTSSPSTAVPPSSSTTTALPGSITSEAAATNSTPGSAGQSNGNEKINESLKKKKNSTKKSQGTSPRQNELIPFLLNNNMTNSFPQSPLQASEIADRSVLKEAVAKNSGPGLHFATVSVFGHSLTITLGYCLKWFVL